MSNLWKKPWVKPVLMGLFISFTLIFGFAAGASYLLIRATRGNVTTTEPITRTTNLTLPKSTRVLGGTWIIGPNKVELFAKVSMPSPDALAFAKQPGFEPLAPGDDGFQPYAEEGMRARGWSWGTRENTLSTRTSVRENQDPTEPVYLLLDRTDPQTTIVYIFRDW